MSFDFEPYRPHADALGLAEAEGRELAACVSGIVEIIVAREFAHDDASQSCAKPAAICADQDADAVQLELNSLRKIYRAAAR